MLNDKQNKSNKFINSKFIDKNDIDRYINIDIEKDMCSDRVYIIKTLHDYMFFINNLLLSYTQGKREDKDKKYRRKYIFRGINNLYTIKSKLYNDNMKIKEKIMTLVKNIYHAKDVTYTKNAEDKIKLLENLKLDKYPICVSKTPMSISDNKDLLGYPKDYIMQVTDIRLNNGAGFIVVYMGNVITLPGLSKESNYLRMYIDDDMHIEGVR